MSIEPFDSPLVFSRPDPGCRWLRSVLPFSPGISDQASEDTVITTYLYYIIPSSRFAGHAALMLSSSGRRPCSRSCDTTRAAICRARWRRSSAAASTMLEITLDTPGALAAVEGAWGCGTGTPSESARCCPPDQVRASAAAGARFLRQSGARSGGRRGGTRARPGADPRGLHGYRDHPGNGRRGEGDEALPRLLRRSGLPSHAARPFPSTPSSSRRVESASTRSSRTSRPARPRLPSAASSSGPLVAPLRSQREFERIAAQAEQGGGRGPVGAPRRDRARRRGAPARTRRAAVPEAAAATEGVRP